MKIIIFIVGFLAGLFAAQLYPNESQQVIENVKELPQKLN